MTKLIKKTPQDAGFAGHRAVIFCMVRSVGQQMLQQLEKKNMLTMLISDEQKLLTKLNELDPDLIFLQVNASTTRSLEQIVSDVFIWMRGRAREINKTLNTPNRYLWERSRIILFKSDVEVSSLGSLSAEIADTDDIIHQCNLSGDVKYIGIYSALSFIGKIRALID